MITKRQRYQGVLVGVLAGDAIGAPYETWGAKAVAEDITKRGGLQFFDYKNPWPKDDNGDMLPAGRPTDDSDQTADLCHSLISCDGVDQQHLLTSLRRSVCEHKSRLWDGSATGAGGTTRKALTAKLVPDELGRVKAPENNIGTNGSLMRCAPMALYFGCEPAKDSRYSYDDIDKMSVVTHSNPHSVQTCKFYTELLSRLLHGRGIQEALEMSLATNYGHSVWRVRTRLAESDYFAPFDPGAWPGRGTAEFSLDVALYALKTTSSFEEGIEVAVRIGGDTDTYAAIAGGLLGAHYGYDAIPKEWRETILGHDVMLSYANQLYDMSHADQLPEKK